MSWSNGEVLPAGTVIQQVAEPIPSSGVAQIITLFDSSGVVHWQGVQGGHWSSLKGWTIPTDLTVALTDPPTTTTTTQQQTITKAPKT